MPDEARPTDDLLEEALFEAKRVLVGQDLMIERLFICWLARGHCLLEGAPGLAKTLAAESLARIIGGVYVTADCWSQARWERPVSASMVSRPSSRTWHSLVRIPPSRR